MTQRRSRPTDAVIKRLFAKSGNRCAFPKCDVRLVQSTTIVAEICHIKASGELGPRFDPHQTDEERHGYDNLILLCPNHHTVIDDDIESYTVQRLEKMKSDHEARNGVLPDSEAAEGTRLLIDQSIKVGYQSGGVTAHTIQVFTQGSSAHDAADELRKEQLAAARKIHNDRVSEFLERRPRTPVLSEAALILHVMPLRYVLGGNCDFDSLIAAVNGFPPMPNSNIGESHIDFSGLLTGSNAKGLREPQRAYVHVSRQAVVEGVWTSINSRSNPSYVELPQLQASLVKFSMVYAQTLGNAGIDSPMLIALTLVGLKGVRLLRQFVERALIVDIPYQQLPSDCLSFGDLVFEEIPRDLIRSAQLLRPLLTHLSNAAGLRESPFFAADGTTALKL